MKVLFVMRHLAYLRLFESSVAILAQAGHTVHLVFTPLANKTFDDRDVRALAQRYPGISHESLPVEHFVSGWNLLADPVRDLRDFLRYLDPLYANAPKLVRRKEKLISPWLARSLRRGALSTGKRRAGVVALLRLVESAIPVSERIRTYLRRIRPDVVLFTPILDGGNQLLDYAKAARAEGLPTALCVASWDNLTNKGVLQVIPDKVIVWNALQREEAVRYHGVPEQRVALTGAPVFDDWFARRPSATAEDFMARVGLAGRRRYVLYLCSSVFIAPQERAFIERWLQALRQTPGLEEVGVLIRPHPANVKQWQADFATAPGVVVWPRLGATPINEDAKRDYFDSLYHAAAVVGVNTSGMIEAGIVGKPVFTVLDEDFKDTQEGTIHFHYLVEGGLLFIGNELSEHCAQLAGVLADTGAAPAHVQRIRDFIADFVRPHGLANPCAPYLAAEVVSTGVAESPPRCSAAALALRAALWAPAALADLWLRLRAPAPERARAAGSELPASGQPIALAARKKKGKRDKSARRRRWAQLRRSLQSRLQTVSADIRFALRRRWPSPDADLEWVRANDYQLQVHRGDHGTVAEFLRRKGVYEGDVVRLFRGLVKPGDHVLDVGANIGYFTVLLSRLVGPQGRVYAVEPDPNNFALLQKNVASNACSNVEAFQMALSDHSGVQTLHTDRESSSVHSLASGNVMVEGGSVSVATSTLDDFARQYIPGGRVDVMKIDAQGAEGQIFSHGETLLTAGAMTMLLEYWPYGLESFGTDPELFLRNLERLGFSFRLMSRKQLRPQMDADALLADLAGRDFSKWGAENMVLSRGGRDLGE